jgi:peptidoglycan/xylan/chitin deacetylase (PgdA/CDA1 family)
MYHSIANAADADFIDPRNRLDPGEFETQIEFLARHRSVVSIETLAEAIEQKKDLAPGTVVITFDDGYRDNYEIAAPVLDKHGLPATLYLPTAMISDGENPWADELYTAFKTRREDELSLARPEPLHFNLSSVASARKAYQLLASELLGADRSRRQEILADIKAQLSPDASPKPCLLDWEKIRAMQRQFPQFTLGLHSDTHIDLTAHGPAVAEAEISRCIKTFEHELGQRSRHFAYPYNRNNPELWDLLRSHGFATAMSTGHRCAIDQHSNPLALPRVAAPRSMTLFKLWTGGSSIPLRFAGSS